MEVKDIEELEGFYTPREIIEALQALPSNLLDKAIVHGWDTGEIYVWTKDGDIEIISLGEKLAAVA